jgi:hypothetical protein
LLRIQHIFVTTCNRQSLIHFVLPLYRCGKGLFDCESCLEWILYLQKQRESVTKVCFMAFSRMRKWTSDTSPP